MTTVEEQNNRPELTDPVARLLTLGRPRPGPQWMDLQALGLNAAHIPALIGLVQDEALHEGEEPAYWAPVHAWRALGQLRADEAVPALLAVLWRTDDALDHWVAEDLPRVLGRIGPAAIPAVTAYLANPDHGLWARTAAGSSLAQIGQQHPEAHAACVTALAGQLEHFQLQDPTLNGNLIGDLTDLGAVDQAELMAAAFAAEKVDLAIQGDWEEVQIELGLLAERLTPVPPDGWIPELAFLRRLMEAGPEAAERAMARAKPVPQIERKDAARRKARRKQEKAAHRRQRRHK